MSSSSSTEIKTKCCKKCNEIQPVDVFKYGKSHCYTCQKIMSNNWKKQNREKVATYNKVYKAENQEKIRETTVKYNIENRDAIRSRSTANYIRALKENPSFKIAHTLRKRIRTVLKGGKKVDNTLKLLGCSLEFFKEWLSYCFTSDMTFENHGSLWHLDHVIPCSKFNLTIELQQRQCFHWSNMKPMYARDNIRKNNKATQEEIEEHEKQITNFMNKKAEKFIDQFTLIEVDRLSYIFENLTV
jgi:hypothetical protein